MADDIQIRRGQRVIRRTGQEPDDEVLVHGGFKTIFNVTKMYRFARENPTLVKPISFTVADAGEVLKTYGRIDHAHADRMPPHVLRQPGIAVTDAAAPVALPLDGFHRLSRLYREHSQVPWVCHAFTLGQAKTFGVLYEVLTPAGWCPVPWDRLERAVDWSRAKAGQRSLIDALAG